MKTSARHSVAGVLAPAHICAAGSGPLLAADAAALPLNRAASPAVLINDGSTRTGLTVLQIINTRASLLGATRVIDDISLDKYTFIRDAYLQRRRSLVFDGDVPETPETPEPGPKARRRRQSRTRRRPLTPHRPRLVGRRLCPEMTLLSLRSE